MSKKKRIDRLIVERGLAPSRSQAQRLIMAGQVRMDGQLVHKASEMAGDGAVLEITALPKYVSRGGEKLEAALKAFEIEPLEWICADVGSSTGGFSDCLLQNGVKRVYAIDVGKGQLHYRLRNDERIISLEETNVRFLEGLPELMDMVTIDVSFISLTYVFPVVRSWLKPEGRIIALIKPQFEAGKQEVGKGGVVKDTRVHEKVIFRVLEAAINEGLFMQGLLRSPLKGPKGNTEFLLHLSPTPSQIDDQSAVKGIVSEDSTANST
jgi:23S rRNA (cytidine1920-2'-O)/16S rRNA (cytidine1409-2'-O)-methyltransferase